MHNDADLTVSGLQTIVSLYKDLLVLGKQLVVAVIPRQAGTTDGPAGRNIHTCS